MADLSAAAALYGATEADLTVLGAFESDVFSFDGPHGPTILKVIAPQHRSRDQVRAEVDWLLSLLEAGVAVSEPLPATSGELVERLGESGHVLVAFRRAPGETTAPPDWSDERVEAWGELLGRLQAHSRGFTPPGPRRLTLAEQSYALRIEEVVPEDDAFVRAAGELWRAAAPLLTHGGDSGLIHADLHHGNLLLHDERWTAIDFDDSAYGAYAFDLAMPLYYAVRSQRGEAAEEVAARFLPPFLRGFRRYAPDPGGGAEAVAQCLTLRQAELVVALRAKLPAEEWNDYLRQVERELRRNVVEGRELLAVDVLQRWL